jgi:2-polyprenyl-3-methyl-5-hydroxy-6-metoxy-1,4-benzoquinol methylase
MRRIPDTMLAEMAASLSAHDRDEMAIPSYRHPNPAMRWMAWRRVEVIAGYLDDLAAKGEKARVLLDFGCGTGVLFEREAAVAERVVGIDLVLGPARQLADAWGIDVELMGPDEAAETIAPGSVDIILAAEVLEHVEPLEPTLDMFARWLKADGHLLVSVPTENRLYRLGRRLAGFEGHYHHDNAESIDRAIRNAGFVRQRRRSIPLPGPLAIYWVLDYTRPG